MKHILTCLLILLPLSAHADFDRNRKLETERFIIALNACAEDKEVECAAQFFEACGERQNWTTVGMQICSAAQHAHWQSEMELVWRQIERRSGGKFRDHMLDAQKTWNAWRDARCHAYRFFEGTMFRPVATDCWAETTFDRLQDLRTILDAGPLASEPILMDLDCDSVADEVMSLPVEDNQISIIYYPGTRDERMLAVQIPVADNRQDALCSRWLDLEKVVTDGKKCPILRIDDGFCDAMFVSRDTATNQWLIDRN